MITAEHVTAAIVRACKATGENVADVVSKERGQRARHYAMHALLHVFQDMTQQDAAALVGCWGTPRQFYDNSYAQTFKMRPDGKRRAAKWFADTVFEDVIAAIRAVPDDPDGVAVAGEPGRKPRRESRRTRRVINPPLPIVRRPTLSPPSGMTWTAPEPKPPLDIDLSKLEKPAAKPPRIEYIPGVQPKQLNKSQFDPKYDAVAYTPKGTIIRKGKSGADLYAELQRAVLNTPGSRPLNRK